MARALGIDVVFINPGTTETYLTHALGEVPGLRSVLCTFEGVCTGAADGFARVSDRPVLAILHLAVGISYGAPNQHNASIARSPVVTVTGDHAVNYRASPFFMDSAPIAGTVSKHVAIPTAIEEVGPALADCVARAMALPRGPVTLILPSDLSWGRSRAASVVAPEAATPAAPDGPATSTVVDALRRPGTLLLIGGRASRAAGLTAAARIARAAGCDVVVEPHTAIIDAGWRLPAFETLPYGNAPARALLGRYQTLVLAGARLPSPYYVVVDGVRTLVEEQTTVLEVPATADPVPWLESIAEALGAPAWQPPSGARPAEGPASSGPLSADSACAALAAIQPEGAIVAIDTGITGRGYAKRMAGLEPCTILNRCGVAIGHAVPAALGASIAAPDRPVIALQGDGGTLMTVQALWTLARERAPVTVVIIKNGTYEVLREQVTGLGLAPNQATERLTDISDPDIDHVALARAFGVEGVSVRDQGALCAELAASFRAPDRPRLIEAVVQ